MEKQPERTTPPFRSLQILKLYTVCILIINRVTQFKAKKQAASFQMHPKSKVTKITSIKLFRYVIKAVRESLTTTC